MNKPRWRKINSPRNSQSTSPLHLLDWSNWWIDGNGFDTYLHVSKPDDGTVHRVYCLNVEECRVGMRDGMLYWIVDSPRSNP